MSKKLRGPKGKVFQLAIDFDTKMEEIGYEDFKLDNPKMAATLPSKQPHPKALKSQILWQ